MALDAQTLRPVFAAAFPPGPIKAVHLRRLALWFAFLADELAQCGGASEDGDAVQDADWQQLVASFEDLSREIRALGKSRGVCVPRARTPSAVGTASSEALRLLDHCVNGLSSLSVAVEFA